MDLFKRFNQTIMHRMSWDCKLKCLQEPGRENTCVKAVTKNNEEYSAKNWSVLPEGTENKTA